MLEGPSSPLSESGVKKEVKELDASLPLLITCSALKPKWLAKIANRKHPLSSLMDQMLQEEFSSRKKHPFPDTPSLSLSDRLQIQQKNFLSVISNLSLPLFSPDSKNENTTSLESSTKEMKEQQLIEWLKEKGYTNLAEKLAPQSGYPWDEIKAIRCPILIEQLVDLYSLSDQKNVGSEKREQLMDFAINLAKMATASNLKGNYMHSHELTEDAKQVLGQLIYLFNNDPPSAIKAIHTPHYNTAVVNINKEFNIRIQDLCYRLQNHYVGHYETQLQAPDVAIHNMIPREIAKALLTDIGSINIGIIDILSDIFLSQEERPLNHEANLSYALKLLQRSPKLRGEFDKIKAPNSSKMPSNDVIRASLGMEASQSINAFHTKLTVLVALLSHLRQGDEGSCFAVSLAIEILSAHLGFCFKDLRQLLQESKLVRQVQNVCIDIPFVKRISDENLEKLITIDSKGCVLLKNRKGAELWEAPGLQAVCLSIGLKKPKKACQAVLADLFDKTSKPVECSVKNLIKKLCEYAQQQGMQQKPLGDMYSQACFAFSSQTSQPLLKIWENAIASMAEAEEGGMVKTAILDSILDSLQFKLGELNIQPTRLLQRLFLNIQKQLYERIRLQYDPAIQGHWNKNLHNKQGGFVLYCHEKRIDNESLFRGFVKTILSDVDQLLQSQLKESESTELAKTIHTLNSYLGSHDFINYLLVRYHPSNTAIVSQLKSNEALHYEALPFTPWVTQTGNNSKAVLKFYFEADQQIAAERFISSGAEEALTNIIEMCKRMSEEEKRLFVNNPNKLKPFCILGKHRLPFMAGNPSLANAWQKNQPTSDWIKEFVISPGLEIANTLMNETTRKQILENLKADVFPHFFSRHEASACLDLIKKVAEYTDIKTYRKALVTICQKIKGSSGPVLENLVRHIDTTICQSLEPALKKKLEDSAVHFADTNWCNGIHDIHFCFAINPGTGQLELWEVYSNGSHLVALDQNYWLFNQKWEFLTIPEELIPDDSSDLLKS
ncbi:Conserved hypothetical protein [Candidatus Protochlamydia naegleriophila]|uniref:Uncharacterized protein n=1 Tax=Candidatus Protochlamydia naegleriophila TaxID=389348 RepID=A0A0U5JCL0_9BACT|nr:hypothetical protein [Candidatus Protochlamydia naegleriophila]CUI17230.1 Conserved hypothetical protein [Candidatus Protochlamydia naegleriophila]